MRVKYMVINYIHHNIKYGYLFIYISDKGFSCANHTVYQCKIASSSLPFLLIYVTIVI